MGDSEDIEGLSKYDDIIHEVLAGRMEGHKCPFCAEGELDCTLDEAMRLSIRCRRCGRFFEGMLA